MQAAQRLMGVTIVSLMLLVAFMGHERYAYSPDEYPLTTVNATYDLHSSTAAAPVGDLANRIALSEARYKSGLKDRAKFITSLGGPSKISSSGGNYWTVWDFFLPSFDCQHYVERIGRMGDGGKWVCGMDIIAKKANPVVYSFGVAEDSSFEAAMLERAPRAQVYGYDYSVNSWGGEIEKNPKLKARAHFHKWAVGDTDAHGPGTDPDFQVYTLDTLMKLNGHEWIDVLKIDVEGAEFKVLRGFCNYYMERGMPLPFGQLQVEIHAYDTNVSFTMLLEWFELLEKAGLRPFHYEPNLVYANRPRSRASLAEYSFINLGGRHELVLDA
ncbi:hypothetical protein CALCODRAFT_499558 [Calocera cornea HHB12733]|uniref:Methyltransferase domain-containing protein n=1 Tax=Calocera cornea HHB12733 TaxID=1353952 RepID=A0A165EDG2_9BASI|nr:hypothetical protein CALCODRAFT_499558 [Calocera cornea HHB12733]